MSRRWGIWVKGLETWCKDGYTLVSEGKYKPEYCLFSTKKEAEKAAEELDWELVSLKYNRWKRMHKYEARFFKED